MRTRLAGWLDDQLAAELRDRGSATTGELREALSEVVIERPLGVCRCRCGAMEHPSMYRGRLDSTDVRAALRRLVRVGAVVEVKTPNPNHRGGHLWLWLESTDGGE